MACLLPPLSSLLYATYVLFLRFLYLHQKQRLLLSSAVSTSSSEKMVSNGICVCWHRYIRMVIYLLTLFASTSIFTQKGFMAEGREIPTLTPVSNSYKGMEEPGLVKEWKPQIGSRPPRCEGRCTSCGRCEAVQVPVTPQVQRHGRTGTTRSETRVIPLSRSDDLSNYKPMSWKCKCGNYFFNP
ncbi:hypothetical protein QN277_017486 [Acacia crassicarpa]|uniref:Epidermal patterning factor-like protein n=1 Tax=Acacia crassicarpa TaxID=499986 RepID=A0AAE1JU45_9FABA|nr:hypothetical protein QN277_017486 [Acacia crassicarpa]